MGLNIFKDHATITTKKNIPDELKNYRLDTYTDSYDKYITHINWFFINLSPEEHLSLLKILKKACLILIADDYALKYAYNQAKIKHERQALANDFSQLSV